MKTLKTTTMSRNRKDKLSNRLRGISSIEYILVFVVIVGTFILLAGFIKQAVSGRMKEVSDIFSHGRQYQPYGIHKTNITVE